MTRLTLALLLLTGLLFLALLQSVVHYQPWSHL